MFFGCGTHAAVEIHMLAAGVIWVAQVCLFCHLTECINLQVMESLPKELLSDSNLIVQL